MHGHIGPDYARVRLGVGHPGHKEAVPGYVLHDFAKSDQDWLDDVLRGVSDGAEHLATGDSGRFLNAVSLRVSPPRSGTGTKSATRDEAAPAAREAPAAAPGDAAPAADEDRSPFQKLLDRFR